MGVVAKIRDKAAAVDTAVRNTYGLAVLALILAALALIVAVHRGR